MSNRSLDPAFLPEVKDAHGDFRAHAPETRARLAYLCADGGLLCAPCANGWNGSRAADPDIDETCPDDNQWRIVGVNFYPLPHLETVACDHCGACIVAPVPE